MNNKGQMGLLIGFFVFIALILGLGFLISVVFSSIDIAVDEIVPVFNEIGVVGNTNVSQAAGYVINPVNTVIQSYTWIGGIMYLIGLFGILGLSFGYRTTLNRWYIGFFFVFAILLLVVAMVISNVYEEIYTGTDDIATRLQDQQILSWLLLYSPLIIGAFIFIGGIIMFSGIAEEGTI